MIDQKQIDKSNSDKKTKREDIKEIGYKDSNGSKLHCIPNKLNENIKGNAQEYSFNESKPNPSELSNDNQMLFKHQIKLINHHLDEQDKTSNYTFKNEALNAKKIEYYECNTDNRNKSYKYNYFGLPKYGLEEKSTQTDITHRELDNLRFIADEFTSLKEEFLINFISNHPDVLKKIYNNALKKKDVPTRIKVNIKRRINSKIQEKSKNNNIEKTCKIETKEKISEFLGEKCQDSNGNIKTVLDDALKRSCSDAILYKVSNSNDLIQNNNLAFNSVNGLKDSSSPFSENFLNKKHLVENLLDSMDRSIKEDLNVSFESPSLTQNISFKKKFSHNKFVKKQLSLEMKISKMQKKKRFDPFNFFKEEYLLSHPFKDNYTIDQVNKYFNYRTL